MGLGRSFATVIPASAAALLARAAARSRLFWSARLRTSSSVNLPAAEFGTAMKYVRATMGQSKIEVFRHILGSEGAAQAANAAFEARYAAHGDPWYGFRNALGSVAAATTKLQRLTGS